MENTDVWRTTVWERLSPMLLYLMYNVRSLLMLLVETSLIYTLSVQFVRYALHSLYSLYIIHYTIYTVLRLNVYRKSIYLSKRILGADT